MVADSQEQEPLTGLMREPDGWGIYLGGRWVGGAATFSAAQALLRGLMESAATHPSEQTPDGLAGGRTESTMAAAGWGWLRIIRHRGGVSLYDRTAAGSGGGDGLRHGERWGGVGPWLRGLF